MPMTGLTESSRRRDTVTYLTPARIEKSHADILHRLPRLPTSKASSKTPRKSQEVGSLEVMTPFESRS